MSGDTRLKLDAMHQQRQAVIASLLEALTVLDRLGEHEAAMAVDQAIIRLTGSGGPLPSNIVQDLLPPKQ